MIRAMVMTMKLAALMRARFSGARRLRRCGVATPILIGVSDPLSRSSSTIGDTAAAAMSKTDHSLGDGSLIMSRGFANVTFTFSFPVLFFVECVLFFFFFTERVLFFDLLVFFFFDRVVFVDDGEVFSDDVDALRTDGGRLAEPGSAVDTAAVVDALLFVNFARFIRVLFFFEGVFNVLLLFFFPAFFDDVEVISDVDVMRRTPLGGGPR